MIGRASLLGLWRLQHCELPLEIQPGTQMEFAEGDALHYLIPTAEGMLRLTLRWRLEGSTLHTSHEDGSNPVAVTVERDDVDVLTVDFGGARAWFARVSV